MHMYCILMYCMFVSFCDVFVFASPRLHYQAKVASRIWAYAMQLSTVQGPSADEDTALYSGTSEETAFCDQELRPRTKKERQAGT